MLEEIDSAPAVMDSISSLTKAANDACPEGEEDDASSIISLTDQSVSKAVHLIDKVYANNYDQSEAIIRGDASLEYIEATLGSDFISPTDTLEG